MRFRGKCYQGTTSYTVLSWTWRKHVQRSNILQPSSWGFWTNCEVRTQRRNNQSENRICCADRVPSHSGFTPGVSTEPFLVCGKFQEVSIMGATVRRWLGSIGRDRRRAREEWWNGRKTLERKGLKANAKKTQVMVCWRGKQRKTDISDKKKYSLKQVEKIKHLG